MGTVLNNRTVAEMRQFFEDHGSGGPYVRGNKEAADMWIGELKQTSKSIHDMQPVQLCREMCQVKSNLRPTAAEVVSEILDFHGDVPYCGACCDTENATVRPLISEKEGGRFCDLLALEEPPPPTPEKEEGHHFCELLALEEPPPPAPVPTQSFIPSNWKQPTVEDLGDEGTLRLLEDSTSHVISPDPLEAEKDLPGQDPSVSAPGILTKGKEQDPGTHMSSLLSR
jgi:hypothetical protein